MAVPRVAPADEGPADASAECAPACEDRTCGDDGCGGTCGTCALGTACDISGACQVESVSMVPMRDGRTLRTGVFLPTVVPAGGVPTLLLRTPYRQADAAAPEYYDEQARFHAARGYAFAYQDTRASVGAGGRFYSYDAEVADGRDTTQWIAAQPWSNGRIGTIGASYEGYTALAAAAANPNVDLVIADAPSAGATTFFPGGMPGDVMAILKYWADDGGGDWATSSFLSAVTSALDLASLDEQLLGEPSPIWRAFLEHPSPADTHWDPMHLRSVWSEICAPVAVIASPVSDQTLALDAIDAMHGIRASACPERQGDRRLLVGPQTHGQTTATLAQSATPTPLQQLVLDHVDAYLVGLPVDLAGVAPVAFLAEGDAAVYPASAWPPPATPWTLVLGNETGAAADGVLRETVSGGAVGTALDVDPAALNPCATQSPAMIFASEAVLDPIFLVGEPSLELSAAASRKDVDFFVYVSDVDPQGPGSSTVMSSGLVRARHRNGGANDLLTPNEPFSISVRLSPILHRISAGHRIELRIEPARCGQPMNPHTGDPIGAQTEWLTANVQILHGDGHSSGLVLPVVAIP